MTRRTTGWICLLFLWVACADSRSEPVGVVRQDPAPGRDDAGRTAGPHPAPGHGGHVDARDAQAGAADAAQPTRDAAAARRDAGSDHDSGRPQDAAPGPDGAAAAVGCAPRALQGADGIRFHHVHLNSVDPDEDMAFYERMFGAPPVEFCRGQDGAPPTRATRTERGWFLYTKVAEVPDARQNTYLEHIGWIHPDPAAELQRLVGLGAPLYPIGRGQCETAFMGTMPCNNYWFYLQAPNGAKVEVARGPGPATTGFGHVHFVMGVDFAWFATATHGAVQNKVIDMVNHTDVAVEESNLAMEQVTDSRGKPIDHLGYSTTHLEAERERLLAAGLELAEDISFKPEYGFRSLFLRSDKGVWIELVEDSPFEPE